VCYVLPRYLFKDPFMLKDNTETQEMVSDFENNMYIYHICIISVSKCRTKSVFLYSFSDIFWPFG